MNRDLPLYADLEAYFRPDGHYLILVDDANRFQQRNLILDLVRRQHDDRRIKLILTVREYALTEVRKAAEEASKPAEINLGRLDSSHIRTLVSEEFGINNPLYLDRIAEVARGNPRLAVMAARVAREQNTLASIADVTILYEAYFGSILKDLEDLGQKELLPVAAIVALFRYVDRANRELLTELAALSGTTEQSFWQRVEELHDLEILDLYDHEVARFSDQILATYLFYLVFFVLELADFDALVRRFYFPYRSRFTDAIYTIANAFDSSVVTNRLRKTLAPIWREIKSDESALLTLMQDFWFVDPTQVLMYLAKQVASTPTTQMELTAVNYKVVDHLDDQSILGILSRFSYASPSDFRLALDLIFDYLDKCPDKVPEVLLCLVKRFGIDETSAARGFPVQSAVVDGLIARSQQDPHGVYPQVFLFVAREYLRTQFELLRTEDSNVITRREIGLRLTPALESFRSKIWHQIFTLFATPEYEEFVLRTLLDYAYSWPDISVPEIVDYDAKHVVPFITNNLHPDRFLDCWVVYHYSELLRRRNVAFDPSIQEEFASDTLKLADFLLFDRTEMQEFDWKEYQTLREKRFREFFTEYGLDDYALLFGRCGEILAVLDSDQQHFEIRQSIERVLAMLFGSHPELYVQVIQGYLDAGDQLRLQAVDIVRRLIAAAGAAESLTIIENCEESIRPRWLFAYCVALPREAITPQHVEQLYNLYRNSPWDAIPGNVGFLADYAAVDKKVIANVTRILTGKPDKTRAAHILEFLLNPHLSTFAMLSESFSGDMDLLKATYFLVCGEVNHADHDGQVFGLLLDVSLGFMTEYIEWLWHHHEGYLTAYHDHRNYSFLWQRMDYESVVMEAVNCLRRLHQKNSVLPDSYLQVFFGAKAPEPKPYTAVEPQMVEFLSRLIAQSFDDTELMVMVFDAAVHVLPHCYPQLLEQFLALNQQVEAFTSLPFQPDSSVAWGSLISVYQERIRFLESLLHVLSTSPKLLRHRHAVEQRIAHFRGRITSEERQQFAEPR